jgi:sterol-4alpha-carboxylate 3-dehydrogenase (decarboxylating)
MTEPRSRTESPVVLITGGAGFLGQRLIDELTKPDSLLRPHEIRVFDPRRGERQGSEITWIRGDVRELEALSRACEGVDVVFHCAAVVDWGRFPDDLLQGINVKGTENVVRACLEAGVPAVVHTSTLDVVYDGKPVIDGDETIPYPPKHFNGYCRTKALGEQIALKGNGLRLRGNHRGGEAARLKTAVIRPSSIWGEADPYHSGSLLEMAKRGPVVRAGDGTARSQFVYVGNVAHAHVLAAKALLEDRPGVSGEAFFVTDFPPKNFFDAMEPIITGAGYKMMPWSLSIPYPVMYGMGCVMEALVWLLRPVYRFAPMISRFSADYVCLDYTFTGRKARERLGYEPVYTEDDAYERTIRYYQENPV